MIVIAASLYLPQHIAFLTHRAWFYYQGDLDTTKSASLSNTAAATATAAVQAGKNMMKGIDVSKFHGAGRMAGSAPGWAPGTGPRAEL
jgi:uncharacterized membrane protein